jgi:uncharacterized protein (TIGR02099 family)
LRALLWALLAAWLLLLLAWAALTWVIVPRIDNWRGDIEARATQALGVPVRIAQIQARSSGLVPSFELQGVALLDPQGREALRLPRVVAALSPRSLLHAGFEQLYLENPELDIRRTLDGKLLVAGLDFSQNQGGQDTSGLDWFFSQPEFVIKNGALRWTDEQPHAKRGVPPPLALTQVDLVLRNPSIALARRHQIRLDATPPPDWGQRLSLQADLREPALTRNAGNWQLWSGQVHADFAQVDVSQLRRYVNLDIEVAQGRGALRVWADVERGQVVDVVADVALEQVQARLAPELEPLGLEAIGARLAWRELPGGFEFSTQNLNFRTQDGLAWPGGNVSVMHSTPNGEQPRGQIQADKLDLSALAQIANRLPLGTSTHALLTDFQPRGRVERLQANWTGPVSELKSLSAKGQVTQLALASHASQEVDPTTRQAYPGRPGIRGANIDFDLNLAGGRAQLSIDKGELDFPGIFEEPRVAMDKLSASTQWTVKGDRIDVNVEQMQFANPHMKGQASGKWSTSDPAKSKAKARFPGTLDLSASLSQADGAKVYRYLPAFIAKPVRDYVQNAIPQAQISSAKVRLKGDLFDMPFADPKLGEFNVSANIQNANFAYAPKNDEQTTTWPALTQLNGELVFDRTAMQIKGANARVEGLPNLVINKAEASIASFANNPTVTVLGEARGPLADMLQFVKTSPLAGMTNRVLDPATANGTADYRLRLALPLASLDKTKVQGSITLAGNDIQLTPASPMLARARGQIGFTERGFQISGAQANMLGGDIRFEGGSRGNLNPLVSGNDPAFVFRGQGVATAEGMRSAKELEALASLAQNATGSTPYSATLSFRQGAPEFVVTSSLQGLAVNAPAPLGKSAEALLPLRYENSTLIDAKTNLIIPRQDQLKIEIGQLASLYFARDLSGEEPRVLRGGIGVGLEAGEAAPVPEQGVVANINFARLDLDAWERFLTTASRNAQADAAASLTYLPTVVAMRAKEIKAQGRTLNNVVVGGSRDGQTWRANLDASELNGYVEFRQASRTNPGSVYARLSRLTLAPAQAAEFEKILDEQPTNVPALDIVVEDMELRGKKLGRIEVEAVNRSQAGVRDWRLNRLSATMPEAQFTATGTWGASQGAGNRRRMVMNFKFDVADSGALLKRMGMGEVIRKGKGKLEGEIAWLGSPLALDYPSMTGQVNMTMEEGQFLKAEPGLAKLLGVLSLQALPRRLTLDFRDVFTEGFSFDFVRGDVRIDQGVAFTNNLQMKGVNAAVLMEGKADIAKETQDLRVVVVPEINAGTASVIATVINPAIGLGTFLAQLILRRPLIEATKQEFQIDGSWTDPKVSKVARNTPAADTSPRESQQ